MDVFKSILLFDGFFRHIDLCRYKNSEIQVVFVNMAVTVCWFLGGLMVWVLRQNRWVETSC